MGGTDATMRMKYIGLYRVMPTTIKKDANNNQIHYSAQKHYVP